MRGRQANFQSVRQFGQRLIIEGHLSKNELETAVKQVEELQNRLNTSCSQRELKLSQASAVQQVGQRGGSFTGGQRSIPYP